jgi:anti-anti-sigma regulatory factor
MNPFSLEMQIQEGIPIIFLHGYFSGDVRQKLTEMTEGLLSQDLTKIIIDFSGCNIINSPGIVLLMDITYRICDEFKGALYLTGMDDLKKNIFKMAGVFALAKTGDSIPEAIQELKLKK